MFSKATILISTISEIEARNPKMDALIAKIEDWEKLGADEIKAAERQKILAKRFPDLSNPEIADLARRVRTKAIKSEVKSAPLDQMKIAMSLGNKKLADTIKTFNLPAAKSCPYSKDCQKDCYAKKAEMRFRDVEKSRQVNFRLAKESKDQLKQLIQKNLKAGDWVRIHEAGDFFSQSYIDMWSEIIAANPDVFFYAYTRTDSPQGTFKGFDFSNIKKHKNFNLISSTVDGKSNYGYLEDIKKIQKEFKEKDILLPICPCSKGNDIQCGVDCKICMEKGREQVLFVKH
jgi:hypothetical protein